MVVHARRARRRQRAVRGVGGGCWAGEVAPQHELQLAEVHEAGAVHVKDVKQGVDFVGRAVGEAELAHACEELRLLDELVAVCVPTLKELNHALRLEGERAAQPLEWGPPPPPPPPPTRGVMLNMLNKGFGTRGSLLIDRGAIRMLRMKRASV
jgi:hypothetical protein